MLTSRYGVEPECPIRVWSVRNGAEVQLRRVPAADAVVRPEVPLVSAEAIGRCPVPFGVDEHVVAVLIVFGTKKSLFDDLKGKVFDLRQGT